MHGRQWSWRFGPGVYGMFSSSPRLRTGIRLLLGLLAPQPPARLAAAVLSHRPPRTPSPPPSHAPAAHVASRLPARQRPAEALHFSPARPEMRLCGGGDAGRAGDVNWGEDARFNGAGIYSLRLWMAKGERHGTLSFSFLKMNTLSSFGDLILFFYLSISILSKPGKNHYEEKKNYGSN